MKRLIALILSVLMISLVFAACSKTDPGQNESKPASSGESADNSGAAEDSSAEEESEDPFEDGLPEKNYGGREFRILQRTEFKYEFENDEAVPEKVNQLVAERNRKVEDRFGVKIVTVDQMGAWGKHEDFMSYIRNSMVQEDPGYDIIAGYAAIMPSAVGDDLFRNWHDLDDWINFDKPWWSQDIVNELTVNGRLYLLTGDISMTFWDMMTGMFFNKELASLYSLDLYSLVRSHDWTFDKMLQICKDTYIPALSAPRR